jgi:hypothetical protein
VLRFMGIQIVHNHVQVQLGIGSHQTVHKVQELAPPPARVVGRTDLTAQDLQGGKEVL